MIVFSLLSNENDRFFQYPYKSKGSTSLSGLRGVYKCKDEILKMIKGPFHN